MLTPTNSWPLPGQVDPTLTPCAFCRRRILVNGKPLFKTCSCKAFGPPVTIAALVVGAGLAVMGLAWALYQKSPRRH
ncbi:MAG: hypothetical protein ACRYFX_26910 [Janthinobacterium lividum]